ncbi:hypothetical protein PHLCEN_2v2817 [Hermanssonia centrifuga]|uniref:Ser-Thr-rich glycosyl-phosphatidyl-inositol-anchored membrane family-domain-containing protein n=1 Tax=Hermanssonia centrifuga TaxID=98765 RepID=A0A2R6RI22_9APHY|nr:hypothetical protein PHLCEN_2v2817 [Hermanssonia centrifuga]
MPACHDYSILAVLAPLASALTFTTPTNWASGGFETVSWTTSAGDPSTFTVELSNPVVFNAALGILNNVNPALQSQNFTLSIVPAVAGYTLQAVNVTDINQVFATSGSFSIAPTVSSTSSLSAGSSASSGSSISAASTTPFGVTVSSTSGSSSASSGGSGSSTSSSSSAGPNPSSFNGNGAASNGAGSWLAMIAAAVAGVAAAF